MVIAKGIYAIELDSKVENIGKQSFIKYGKDCAKMINKFFGRFKQNDKNFEINGKPVTITNHFSHDNETWQIWWK